MSNINGGVYQSIPHDSGHLHVTGEAIYIDDIKEVEETQHAYILKSPHAYAKIIDIDISKAKSIKGVSAVVTAKDIPGKNDIAPIFSNEPALAEDYVEYAGQPVVALCANNIETAIKASQLIDVKYEILKPIIDVKEAYEKKNLLTQPQLMQRGDYKKGLKEAKNKIKKTMYIGGQDHFYLETQIAYALPKEDDCFYVYSSTQHPREVQQGICHVLGCAQHKITVEQRRMGGGFGGKESQPTIYGAIACLLSKYAKKPVKVRLNRDDDMIMTGKRHHFMVEYEVGFDDEGVIKAIDMVYAAGSGSVADCSAPVVQRALCHADNCYYLENVRVQGFLCKTNTQPNTAFRGFGGPQGMLGIEHCLDNIASYLNIAPHEVRLRNFYGKTKRNITPYGQEITDNIIDEVTQDVFSSSDFYKRRKEIIEFNKKSKIIKKGIAFSPVKFGISFNAVFLNQAGALIHIYQDGSVLINQGGTEMGQGLFSKMKQVIAEIFQIDIENVSINATVTDKVPNTSATAASSDTDINGMAMKDAAYKIKSRLVKFVAEKFNVLEDDVLFDDNMVYAGENEISFKELVNDAFMNRVSLSSNGFYKTPVIHFDAQKMQGRPFYYYAYGACVSEVAIDILTGENRVLRTDILHDCGSSINPAIDIGQVEGGFVQGMGWLTMEELYWDEKGELKTHAPSTYKIPVSRDMPKEFNVRILEESPNKEDTIFNSKATGEPPLMLGMSVWLALRDAVYSISDYKLAPELNPPATSEAVLKAVDEIKSKVLSF